MDESRVAFLQRLVSTPGPSGFEQRPARIWREEARSFADEVDVDLNGNSYAIVHAKNRDDSTPVVLIAGHIDEIGFIITNVDEEGYLWFDPIGGWDDQVVVGQRIRIINGDSDVIGVVGRKPAHQLKAEDRAKPVKLDELWIDIGAASQADALKLVEIGNAAVIDSSFVVLDGDRRASRSMDNRVGAFVALETARLAALAQPTVDVIAVATVQEETGFVGAMTAAFWKKPIVAIAVDLTHATDYPGAAKQRHGDIKLGGGPTIGRAATISPVVFAGLRAAAARLGLNCPLEGAGNSTWTDADAMIHSGRGAATGLVSVPARYMHSPNETLSLADVENASRLIAEFISTITPESDFRPL